MSDDAQAVTAILGSRLLTAAKENEKIRSSPASSGSAAIDRRVLDGGFRYGEISLVSGLSGTGKTLVSVSLMSGVFVRCKEIHFVFKSRAPRRLIARLKAADFGHR